MGLRSFLKVPRNEIYLRAWTFNTNQSTWWMTFYGKELLLKSVTSNLGGKTDSATDRKDPPMVK